MKIMTNHRYRYLLVCLIYILLGVVFYQTYYVNSSSRYPHILYTHTVPNNYKHLQNLGTSIRLKPDAFTKIYPAYAETIINSGMQLQWSKSEGGSSCEYCVVATPRLCTTWNSVSTNLFAYVPFTRDGSYYWRVRAINSSGITLADIRIWYFFAQRYPTNTLTSTQGSHTESHLHTYNHTNYRAKYQL